MMRNLVDNAIRYTPAGGKIVVSLTNEPNGYRFTVCDNGPGIPPAERAAVLRRFHRLNHQDQPGSGLGLSIVSRIAELHGAQIALGEGDAATGLSISVTFGKT
jgi:signal transduction histidine kinase